MVGCRAEHDISVTDLAFFNLLFKPSVIYFAVASYGKFCTYFNNRRHHVCWQTLTETITYSIRKRLAISRRALNYHTIKRPGVLTSGKYTGHSPSNSSDLRRCGLNFSQFDPVTGYLDLTIPPAKELDITVIPHHTPVTCIVTTTDIR